jgi:cytochrome c oxidase subunit I
VIAHFHYIMVGGTIMAYLGGLPYRCPKMSGRMYPEGWAKLSALIIYLGFAWNGRLLRRRRLTISMKPRS